MNRTVLLIATFDTKEQEALFLVKCLQNRGVEVLGANRTGLFINLIPVFASILAIFFLGETLQAFHIVGMTLIFSGMILFNR